MAQSQVHVEALLPWFIASFFLVVHPTNPFIWIITTIVESSITFQTVLETFCMFILSSLYSVSGTIFCNSTNISTLPPTPGFPGGSAGKESACNEGGPALIPGSGRSTGEVIGYPLRYSRASLVAQTIKNLPAIRETWVRSWVGKIPWRGNDYPLQYSGLENSMDYIVHGLQRVGHDWEKSLYLSTPCGAWKWSESCLVVSMMPGVSSKYRLSKECTHYFSEGSLKKLKFLICGRYNNVPACISQKSQGFYIIKADFLLISWLLAVFQFRWLI